MEKMIAKGEELDDHIIDAAQQLLNKQFPDLLGLWSTHKGSSM